MKKILLFTLIIITGTVFSQEKEKKKVETKIHVEGVCKMCKERIEDAAYIKGVKFAEWDKEKKELMLVYSPQITDLKKIQKSIAKAGHASKDIPADKEAYKKLPDCCKYADGVETH